MLLARLKIGMSLLLVLAFVGGVGLRTQSAPAQQQAEEQPKAAREDCSGEPQVPLNLNKHTQVVVSVVFSPDGKTLASASHDKTVKLWDTATGKERATLQGHTQGVVRLARTARPWHRQARTGPCGCGTWRAAK